MLTLGSVLVRTQSAGFLRDEGFLLGVHGTLVVIQNRTDRDTFVLSGTKVLCSQMSLPTRFESISDCVLSE